MDLDEPRAKPPAHDIGMDLDTLSVDELTEMASIDAERAAALIMKAREPWFAEAENE